jgi:hypothetical protein
MSSITEHTYKVDTTDMIVKKYIETFNDLTQNTNVEPTA